MSCDRPCPFVGTAADAVMTLLATEFKDVRKAWRKRKKDEARMAAEAALRTGVMDPAAAEAMAWEAEGKWLAH